MGLPLFDILVSGGSHGQDNKLDTYKAAQLGSNVLSRISRHLIGIINVVMGRPYHDDCQKPYAYFNRGDKSAQGPKTTKPNTYIMQPRDLTAYVYNLYLMRRRSFHSSLTAKGSSRKSSLQENHVSNQKDSGSLNPKKGSETKMSVSM